MGRPDWRRLAFVVGLIGCLSRAPVTPARAAGDATPPNVLLIFVDDLGYADLGCQGSPDVKSPRIDSLATNGVRCTAGYVSASQCCPSRAGLLTGRYQNRFGFETNPDGDATAGLPRDERTIADELQAAGYATGMVGKWHLGTAEGMQPWERGFAESLWHPNRGVLFPAEQTGLLPGMRRGREPADMKGYSTDAFGDAAVDFITRHAAIRAADGRPWFFCLSFVPPHWPMEAKPEYMAAFAAEPDLHRRTLLAMMASLDENVGKVLDALDATGQRDDTLVFFLSDNGGPTGRPRPRPDAPFQFEQNTSRNHPFRGVKGNLFEGVHPRAVSRPLAGCDPRRHHLRRAGNQPRHPADGSGRGRPAGGRGVGSPSARRRRSTAGPLRQGDGTAARDAVVAVSLPGSGGRPAEVRDPPGAVEARPRRRPASALRPHGRSRRDGRSLGQEA